MSLKQIAFRSIIVLFPARTPVNASEKTSALSEVIRTEENMEPAIARPAQGAEVAKKLAASEGKMGKRPSIFWLMVDQMGHGDLGVYGGLRSEPQNRIAIDLSMLASSLPGSIPSRLARPPARPC